VIFWPRNFRAGYNGFGVEKHAQVSEALFDKMPRVASLDSYGAPLRQAQLLPDFHRLLLKPCKFRAN
jgi:hypothetical protein